MGGKSGPNHKSHAMTSLEFFEKGTFVGQRYRRIKDQGRDGNRLGRPAPIGSTGRSGCRSGRDSSTGRQAG